MLLAMAKLVGRYPKSELHIYGDGALKSSLIDMSLKLGIENNVFFEGRTSHIYDELVKYIKLNLDESELDKIFNIFIDMSNTDVDKTKQNVEKIAILNEIIRDFWISSGYAYNEGTFVYDYELLLNDIS